MAMCGLFSVLRASVGPLLRDFRVSKLNVIWTITGDRRETAILYGQTLTPSTPSWQSHRTTLKYRRISSGWRLITPAAPNSSVVSLKLLLCPLLALVVLCFMHAWHDPQLLPQNTPNTIPETNRR
ncbi:MAG: hypothetical protein ACLVHY_05475 [Gemmiger sp.]